VEVDGEWRLKHEITMDLAIGICDLGKAYIGRIWSIKAETLAEEIGYFLLLDDKNKYDTSFVD